MIIKRVRTTSWTARGNGAARPNTRGSLAKVAAHITDTTTADNVPQPRFTNCRSIDLEDAVREIELTRDLDLNWLGQKTLVIAFAPGESPPSDALLEIEDALCAAAGLGARERISVAHQKGDRLTIHFVASTIDQTTGGFTNIHNDYQRTRAACLAMEEKFGLVTTTGRTP